MAYCDDSLTIKRIYFTNMVNNTGSWSFYNKTMFVSSIDNETSDIISAQTTSWGY